MSISPSMSCLLTLLLVGVVHANPAEDPVVAAVQARDAEIADAHGRGDLATYRAGLSERYVYIDIGGKRITADMLAARRQDDQRRVVASESSEEEAVRLSDSVVLLRGLERSVASYYGGLPWVGASRWSALWVREDDGIWRLVADTATPVRKDDSLPFVVTAQSAETLAPLAGRWSLALTPPLELVLQADKGNLRGKLSGQTVHWTFQPASARHFIAKERPFELRFAGDGQSLELVTWGIATAATRIADPQQDSAQ